MKKIKAIITLDLECPDDRCLVSVKEMCENVMDELASNTHVVPWNRGYKGKITVRVKNGKDQFAVWCLLEEIKEYADKTGGE